MSMKKILGMMLASRMAGRGARGGMGGLGGLGGLAAGGLIGGRSGGLGRKAGLAALGYMAYQAYQNHQARNAATTTAQSTAGRPHAPQASGGGIGDAIGGLIKSVSDAISGPQASQDDQRSKFMSETGDATPAFTAEDERAADSFSEETALLLVRAMVAAANADGTISTEERFRITSQLEAGGADDDDRRSLERELANPRPLEELLGQVRDKETAEEFYLASRMAIDTETDVHRAYLTRLRERLGLDADEASQIETLAS